MPTEDEDKQGFLPDWLAAEDLEVEDDYQIEEYDLTSSPNDFNVSTIYNFIESGAVKIPTFQRNYVWDINRASKLIESIMIGLPVPQIFLYEEGRNRFLVVDGQQRLMTIYYFVKKRFPKKEKRAAIRRIFSEKGKLPDDVLYSDEYFADFKLRLPSSKSDHQNKFDGLTYSTLGEAKLSFDLRAIRNIIVKQNSPKDDDSSIYEIFNRLNSGGMNLQPQEIRGSLYYSNFYTMLYRVNLLEDWRRVLGSPEPDPHMRDVEILLRSFAMLLKGDKYKSSMARFLDGFSKDARKFPDDLTLYLESLFTSFASASSALPQDSFQSGVGKFNISIFESVFTAVCSEPMHAKSLVEHPINEAALARLQTDVKFKEASERQTTNKANVEARLNRAKEIFGDEFADSARSDGHV